MPVLLSLAALPLLFTLFWQAKDRPDRPARAWDEAFLLAVTFWAATAISLVELLSAFEAVAFGPLAAAWAAVDAILFGVAWAVWRGRRTNVTLRRPNFTRLDILLLGILGAYALALAAVAWAAPPNNVDSLQYHMARVVHWAQQGSLAHYGTGFGPQLWNPPGAEIFILNLRTLAVDDRLANFVQWFAYLASLVGVWWIGKMFGLGRTARWAAVGFAASIPMVVLQATSTQNDMVAAFWLVVLAAFVLSTLRRPLTLIDAGGLGLALGVGLLTKATSYFYVVPFLVWMTLSRPWRTNVARSLRDLLMVAAVAVALNVGHISRNLSYGWTPFGSLASLQVQAYPASPKQAVAIAALRPLQVSLLNFATPSPELNERLVEGIARLQSLFGISGERPLLTWDWNHEEVAGNPIHFLLLLLSGALLVFQRRWSRECLAYAACLAAGFVFLPTMVSSAVAPVNIRYQLPILVGWAPLIGLVLGRYLKPRALGAAAVVLILLGLPWLLFNKSRPIIAMRPDPGPGELPCLAGCSAIGSVFSTPKADILFANRRENLEGYLGVSNSLRTRSCRKIGLRLESYEPEYALWYLLDAPQSGFHLETIYTSPDLEPLLNRGFRPCAIVCTICGGRTRLHGFDLYSGWGPVRVYVGDTFTWDEDG